MIEIEEGVSPIKLIFSFPDDWSVCKFDENNFYRKRVEKLDGMKAVDILVKNELELKFIEIKDFREHRIENTQRQRNGELLIEVAKKFVNTISALHGAYRWSIEDLEPFYTSIISSAEQKIELILFIERDDEDRRLKKQKLTLVDLQQKLKKYLYAYKVKCKVYDRNSLPRYEEWQVR